MSTPSASAARLRSPRSRGKNVFTIWIIIIALALAALFGTYMLFVEAPPPTKIVIATGGTKGAYYDFGKKYAAELKKQGLTLEVRETKGSVENLQLLNDDGSGVAAAIVQSGVASPEDHERLMALGSLYREPLWVFYRAETPLYTEAPPPKKVVIATGGKTGAYYQFAQKYAEELKKEGLTLEVKETKGSVENLNLLKDDASGVDVAIVQSGVAGPMDGEQVAALGSLYREPLWVFYRGTKEEKALDRLSDLAGKQINIGPKGSGTYPVAMQLLAANGLVVPSLTPYKPALLVAMQLFAGNGLVDLSGSGAPKVDLSEAPVTEAAKKLHEGKLDAAFFVASIETNYIKNLIKDDNVRLMSFSQYKGFHHKFRFLSEVTIPKGLINLGQNIPDKDINLVAPTAMLVVRKKAHPSLAPLLVTVAARVHAKGDQLSNPGEFPSASYTDLPVSEEAKQFYKTGSFTLPRVPPIDRLSYLEGKHINVGPVGSGTYAIAMQLLKANGMLGKFTPTTDGVDDAAKKLQAGKLDAAFFVAAPEAKYIQDLMHDPFMRLLSFSQHEAYQRKFRFLSEVTIPAGLVDLGHNIPRQDISLIAPTAMLVVRKDMHPALISVLLTAATKVHSKGDELTSPGEFPSASFTDLPVSEDAKHFYKSGPPVLQRILPFWLASMVDRLKIMLIPLIMLLLPLFRAAPPLMAWRTRRKIYKWYAALQEIDRKLVTGLSRAELEVELARLSVIEHQVTFVQVPLSYMDQLYHLRLHLNLLQDKLKTLRAGEIR